MLKNLQQQLQNASQTGAPPPGFEHQISQKQPDSANRSTTSIPKSILYHQKTESGGNFQQNAPPPTELQNSQGGGIPIGLNTILKKPNEAQRMLREEEINGGNTASFIKKKTENSSIKNETNPPGDRTPAATEHSFMPAGFHKLETMKLSALQRACPPPPIQRLKTENYTNVIPGNLSMNLNAPPDYSAVDTKTRTTYKFDEMTTINSRRPLHHADLIATDINDLFLRASFTGDNLEIKRIHNTLTQEEQLDEDTKLMNQQVKTANFFLNKNETLKVIIVNLSKAYEALQLNQSNNVTDQGRSMDQSRDGLLPRISYNGMPLKSNLRKNTQNNSSYIQGETIKSQSFVRNASIKQTAERKITEIKSLEPIMSKEEQSSCVNTAAFVKQQETKTQQDALVNPTIPLHSQNTYSLHTSGRTTSVPVPAKTKQNSSITGPKRTKVKSREERLREQKQKELLCNEQADSKEKEQYLKQQSTRHPHTDKKNKKQLNFYEEDEDDNNYYSKQGESPYNFHENPDNEDESSSSSQETNNSHEEYDSHRRFQKEGGEAEDSLEEDQMYNDSLQYNSSRREDFRIENVDESHTHDEDSMSNDEQQEKVAQAEGYNNIKRSGTTSQSSVVIRDGGEGGGGVNNAGVSQENLTSKNTRNFNYTQNKDSGPIQNELLEHLDSQTNFKSISDMLKFRQILQSQVSTVFNTNMLKIALNLKEDRVAAVIVADFPVTIDEVTLNFSIQACCLNFIHHLFLFDKTDILPSSDNEQRRVSLVKRVSELINDDTDNDPQDRVRQFTIDELIMKIADCFDKKESERLFYKILPWRIEPKDNILMQLCDMGQERVATHFMNCYPMLSNIEFFLNCIDHERIQFVKQALSDQFFDLDYMHNLRTIRWIVQRLVNGNNILFALNLLLYANFRKWPNDLLKEFTKAAALIISNQLEKNVLLITHNPIMTLGLMIQYLNHLKSDFNEFDTECHKLVEKFYQLGRAIIEDMQFDHVEEIFMDRDFHERTVLNIITDNEIMPFIVINKLHFLIDKIWDGKESDLIDGKISHFSKTKYLLNHEIKRLRGVKVSINDIMGHNFKANIEDYNFIYQLKFRMQSVLFLFYKDFICAAFVMGIFQFINYSYLNLFTERRYQHVNIYEEKVAIIKTNIATYNQYNFIGTILSVSYFLNLVSRVIYNSLSKKKIPMDIWLTFDCVAGTVNIIAFNYVGNSSPDTILNIYSKRVLDYYMIIVLIISWIRFFSYFLVMQHISKITLTLFMMLKETVFFMMILTCYLVLMTTVFSTLFRDTETEDAVHDYHNIFTTLRALIDYFLANFQVKEMGKYSTSHAILYIVHVTISNIFLLNFLVAILQTVFDIMIKNGDFYAIEYQYIFITKYMKAMEDDSGYDKLILFPPPLNFLLIPMILASPSRRLVKSIGQFLIKLMFWLENLILIILFLLYMLAHDPLIIVKTSFQILTKIDGILNKVMYLFLWLCFGLIFLLSVNLKDTCMLLNILLLENSVIFDQGEEERNKSEQTTFYINRNVIRAINQLKGIADISSDIFHKRQSVQRLQTQKMSIRDKIKNQQDEMRNEDIFIVRKELIIAVYEEISARDPFIQRHRKQQHLLEQAFEQNLRESNSQGNFSMYNSTINFSLTGSLQEPPPPNQQQTNMTMDLGGGGETGKSSYTPMADEPQVSSELRNIISKLMLSRNRDNIYELVEYMLLEKEKNYCYPMTEDEGSLVDQFISKFSILQQNQETQTIDLDLVVKGFPKVLTKHSIKKIYLLNFQRMQRILISFFNDDQDEMFNYYDNRMTRRLDQLRDSSTRNSTRLDWILEITKNLYNFISIKQHLQRSSTLRGNPLDIITQQQTTTAFTQMNTNLTQATSVAYQPTATTQLTQQASGRQLGAELSVLQRQVSRTFAGHEGQMQGAMSSQQPLRKQATLQQIMKQATIRKQHQQEQQHQNGSDQKSATSGIQKKASFRENGGFLFGTRADQETEMVNDKLNSMYRQHQMQSNPPKQSHQNNEQQQQQLSSKRTARDQQLLRKQTTKKTGRRMTKGRTLRKDGQIEAPEEGQISTSYEQLKIKLPSPGQNTLLEANVQVFDVDATVTNDIPIKIEPPSEDIGNLLDIDRLMQEQLKLQQTLKYFAEKKAALQQQQHNATLQPTQSQQNTQNSNRLQAIPHLNHLQQPLHHKSQLSVASHMNYYSSSGGENKSLKSSSRGDSVTKHQHHKYNSSMLIVPKSSIRGDEHSASEKSEHSKHSSKHIRIAETHVGQGGVQRQITKKGTIFEKQAAAMVSQGTLHGVPPRLSIHNTLVYPQNRGQFDIGPASPYQNYQTQIGQNQGSGGSGNGSSAGLAPLDNNGMPLTAEQLLEHIRAQRREKSNEESSQELQEFSASDFSSYYSAMRKGTGTIITHHSNMGKRNTLAIDERGQETFNSKNNLMHTQKSKFSTIYKKGDTNMPMAHGIASSNNLTQQINQANAGQEKSKSKVKIIEEDDSFGTDADCPIAVGDSAQQLPGVQQNNDTQQPGSQSRGTNK